MEALRERFGKYHVLEKIAQGGMAEVYKVKTVGIAGFEKVQALKRILPASAREGRFIRSFIDEARIAVELTHRNIVQVFDFGKADGELFLAMELIEGKDLRSAMSQGVARDLPVPMPVAAYILSEVAAGLDYAHRKADVYGTQLNIVHCDVSPSNVMLSSDGYVKILDFGIARATFASALERRRLRGKPRYMAPEQTYGDAPTAAADVFALGIIAWELFTGLPLYRGPNVKAILEMVRTTVPPRIDRMNPEVPVEIVDAVETALRREPTRRGTAADLAASCARMALQGGSPKLAAWLADVETRSATADAAAWQPGHTSMSVGKQTGPTVPPNEPVERPTLKSITQSLANVPTPGGELGEGTPGFEALEPRPPTERESAFQVLRESTATILPLREATSTSIQARFAPIEPSTTGVRAYDPPPPASFAGFDPATPAFGARSYDPATQPAAPRFGDADASFQHREATVPSGPPERFSRPSYEALQFALGVAPSALRFDDDATQHGMQLPPDDDFALEPDAAAPVDLLEDEPIDDDLGPVAGGALTERRRAVIVAAQLGGAAAELLRTIAHTLGELAYQRGGVVTEQTEDGLVVAFGLEIAGEDDVAIAMGWAIDATTYVRDARGEEPITLRIGARTNIATSNDETGSRIPLDAAEDARALAREAAPERPLFAGSTGRITSGLYELREVTQPRRSSSGISSHLWRRGRVLELIGPRGLDERARERAKLVRRGAFIGRAQQLAELEAWFQRAVAADRRLVVLIVGAAGTGKTRLVAELIARREAASTSQRIVSTGASPAHHLSPFALLVELYQSSLGLAPARGRSARKQLAQRVHHMLAPALTPERARAVATDLDRAMELRDGVGVGAPEIADLRPRVAAGLAAFRAALSDRAHPLLTVIEDIHLSDSASLEVLRHTLAVSATGPELLVLTTRPDGPPPPAVDIVLEVGDLVGGELRALVKDRLGPAASPLNMAAVLARGGGNPLFVEELAQAVREAGEADNDVPASARDVVAARVDRLSARAKAALRYAAVLGGDARIRLLEELVDDSEVGEGLASEIEELVATGFAELSADDGIELRVGLVREVVYDALSARAQRESHARVGRLLASRYFAGREEPPAEVAEHLERGGELAGAAAFWLRAGRLALTASDGPAAIACFSRTIVLERELGATPPTPTSRTRRREALAGREEARRLVGDLVSDPGDLDELQRLCEGDPARLADVSIRRAQRMLRYGDYANAMIATVVAEDHGAAAQDDRLRGEALRIRGEILERLGQYDEALAVVAGARELFHRKGATHDEMAAMIGRGRIHLMRAHYELARDAYRPVLALIDKTGDPWLERIVTNHVAVIEMCLGNFTAAMTSAQRSLELCRRYGDRAREGDGLSVAGIILLEVGLFDQAAQIFTESLDILSRTGSRWSRADCLIYAGVCELRRGNVDGLALLDEALSEARRLGARYLEANALVARAGAHLRRNALAPAIEDAVEGTHVAQTSTLVGYEVQGLARQGLALSRAGRTPEAVQLVNRALALLEHQKYLEGSEEEVLAACADVLDAARDPARALQVRERGRASAQRKHDALIDPVWRAAYAAIPEIAALLAT